MAEPEKTKSRAKQSIDFPLILLGVLLTIVAVLIFIGYDYLRDEAPNAPAIVVNTPEANAPADKKEEKSIEKVAVKNDNDRPKKNEKIEKKASSTLPASAKKQTPKAPLPEGKTITHLVKTGENFGSVARRYHLSSQILKALNPGINETDVKANVKLKIRVKAVHTVGPGDILSKVAAKYGVSKDLIMAANGKTKDYAARGETLIIPLP